MKRGEFIRNKKKRLSFISSIIVTLFLLTNITVPVQAATSKLNSKAVSKVTSSVVKVSV